METYGLYELTRKLTANISRTRVDMRYNDTIKYITS
jgi:hypothetical protein